MLLACLVATSSSKCLVLVLIYMFTAQVQPDGLVNNDIDNCKS